MPHARPKTTEATGSGVFYNSSFCIHTVFPFRMESSSLHVGTLVRLTKVLRVSLTGLLGESMSARQWLQMGEARFATREDAED